MTRQDFRDLAEARSADAAALLAAGRWAGAYYLAGYAVECGLKACVMKRVGEEEGGMLFVVGGRNGFQQKHCLTHKLVDLVVGAGLEDERVAKEKSDAEFAVNWQTVSRWSEKTRYQDRSEGDARAVYNALTELKHGVLPWIQHFW